MNSKFQYAIDYVKRSKKPLLLIIIVAIASVSTTTLGSILLSKYGNYSIPSLGYVKTIGVRSYGDQNCDNITEIIDWGVLEVGASNTVALFIKSVSNYDILLAFNVTDWKPISISEYLTVFWNYNGTVIKPGEVIQVTFRLSALSSSDFINYLIKQDIRQFSCLMYIVAFEV